MAPQKLEVYIRSTFLNKVITHMHKLQSGYILLTSAILLMVIGLIVATSIVYFARSFEKNDLTIERSNQAKGLANTCAELGVQKLITTPSYTGNGNSTLGSGSCVYGIIEPTGTTAVITATGTVNSVIRKVQVSMDISPSLSVTRWQEIP